MTQGRVGPVGWLGSGRVGRVGLPRRSPLGMVFLMLASPALAQTTAIRAGTAITPSGPIANAVIVVENDRIVSVGTSAPPAGAQLIDLRRFTVVPGMIDVHVHMTYYWDRTPGTRPLGQPRRPAGVTTVLAAENARRTLETGVTTVRDLGASNEVDYAMRDLICDGPDGRAAHVRRRARGSSAARGSAVDPDAFRQQAEARIAAGSDWIKIFGSRGSYQSVETTQTVPFEAMKAVVDAAHAKNHKVAIHSYGPSGVQGRGARPAPTRSSTASSSTTRRLPRW